MRFSAAVVKFGNFADLQTRQPSSSFSEMPQAVNASRVTTKQRLGTIGLRRCASPDDEPM